VKERARRLSGLAAVAVLVMALGTACPAGDSEACARADADLSVYQDAVAAAGNPDSPGGSEITDEESAELGVLIDQRVADLKACGGS
jgi:hypothetical protein